ncbi:hypothetical protein E2320_019845 [Naja naja]|nr:hypothetical protein E2320_019845 [Naja naja]
MTPEMPSCVNAVTLNLEGDAMEWLVSFSNEEAPELMNMDTFVEGMWGRFEDPTETCRAEARIHSIQQGKQLIVEYIEEFLSLIIYLRGWLESVLVYQFRDGLNQGICIADSNLAKGKETNSKAKGEDAGGQQVMEVFLQSTKEEGIPTSDKPDLVFYEINTQCNDWQRTKKRAGERTEQGGREEKRDKLAGDHPDGSVCWWKQRPRHNDSKQEPHGSRAKSSSRAAGRRETQQQHRAAHEQSLRAPQRATGKAMVELNGGLSGVDWTAELR